LVYKNEITYFSKPFQSLESLGNSESPEGLEGRGVPGVHEGLGGPGITGSPEVSG
jgi:hypothetical protein